MTPNIFISFLQPRKFVGGTCYVPLELCT